MRLSWCLFFLIFFFHSNRVLFFLFIAAITAIIQENGETFHSKKSYEKITKKNYKRQNLVAKQRNGPIIRKQKMFTHLNGAYHTRNQNY